MSVAISVKNLYKSFLIPDKKRTSFVEFLKEPFTHNKGRKLKVLDGISFNVNEGESVGIMGNNGEGKSTLLKLLAGILVSEKGEIEINGKMIPFLELGVGFNPELTARENIFLNGIILGMEKKKLKEQVDYILDFAELTEFADLSLKNFSSGMQVRLAFSIAFLSEANVYLLDEVFAVGDVHFQEKCLNVLKEKRSSGKTILLVSHSIETVKSFCDRVLVLNNGEIIFDGNTKEGTQVYASTL